MSKSNVALLESGGYKYIIGARIKNEPEQVKQWTFSLDRQNNEFYELKKDNTRLIIGYSTKRAKKDKYNREKGVKRLQNAYRSGSITKENINKRGYNKFLEISSNIKVKLPISNKLLSKTMLITSRHKSIEMLFDDNFWSSI